MSFDKQCKRCFSITLELTVSRIRLPVFIIFNDAIVFDKCTSKGRETSKIPICIFLETGGCNPAGL